MTKLLPITMTILALSLSACGGDSKKKLDAQAEKIEKQSQQELANLKKEEARKAAEEEARKNKVEIIGVGEQGEQGKLEGDNSKEVGASEMTKTFEPIIRFQYEQYVVDDEGLASIKHYANVLQQNLDGTITLVGHTDERGTPEYNIALGEKRAKSVKEAFMLYGVRSNRIDLVTLGEEQPIVDESNENAWAQNRRVEIKIK